MTNRHSETRIQSPIRKRLEMMTTIIEEKVMAEDEETLDTGEMRRQPQEQTSPRQVFTSDWLLMRVRIHAADMVMLSGAKHLVAYRYNCGLRATRFFVCGLRMARC